MKKQRIGTSLICLLLTVTMVGSGFFYMPAYGGQTASPTPDKLHYGGLKWALNLGTGYSNAPTPPLIQDGFVYVGMNQTLYKLDKETGTVVKQLDLVESFGFATAALTYAENVNGKNVIFAPLSEGRVQAINADTMTSLWVTAKSWGSTATGDAESTIGLSCLSRVTYDDGYIYYGTWKTDTQVGKYFCFSAQDPNTTLPTETKKPIWKVEHTGGFYWSEANAQGDYLIFGSEDGNGDYSVPTTGSNVYSCLKGSAYVEAGRTYPDSPVVDQVQTYGDIRSGVAYDSQTDSYYFTSRGKRLYKTSLHADGTFDDASFKTLTLSGVTTGTPTVYQGLVFVGVQGPTPFGTTGHAVNLIDGETMKVLDTAATPGFVQSEMLLSTSKVSEGKAFLYMTYNQLPGGIYMMEIHGLNTSPTMYDPGCGPLFTPPASMQHYGISTLVADVDGNLYYKNDSCNLIAIKAGYMIDSAPASGGVITKTQTVAAGSSCKFTLTPKTGYKIADVKVDGISKGSYNSYTFTNISSPHSIRGVFINTTMANFTGAQSTGYNSVKLSWNKAVGVSGYEIWRSTSPSSGYQKLKIITSATTFTYQNTGLTTGKTYYYRIRGYYLRTTGTKVYTYLSPGYRAVTPRLTTPVLSTTAGTDRLKLSWKTIPGAHGYKIYKKSSTTGYYYIVKTITSGTVNTWTNYGLTTGKTYYYKMIAYRVVNGKTFNSYFSNVGYRKPF